MRPKWPKSILYRSRQSLNQYEPSGLANNADQDQTQQNVASDQGSIVCLQIVQLKFK